MKIENSILHLEKEVSEIDRKVLSFTQTLVELNIDYVIVSGYVAILTGRSRGTEDIDFLIRPDSFSETKFNKILDRGYWTVDATKSRNIEERLTEGISTRLAEEGEVIPNFEVFYPTTKWDSKSIENKLEVNIKDQHSLFISPLELQIIYKLYLGSEKDFEDALHLFTVFKHDLENRKLEKFSKQMNVYAELKRLRKT